MQQSLQYLRYIEMLLVEGGWELPDSREINRKTGKWD